MFDYTMDYLPFIQSTSQIADRLDLHSLRQPKWCVYVHGDLDEYILSSAHEDCMHPIIAWPGTGY